MPIEPNKYIVEVKVTRRLCAPHATASFQERKINVEGLGPTGLVATVLGQCDECLDVAMRARRVADEAVSCITQAEPFPMHWRALAGFMILQIDDACEAASREDALKRLRRILEQQFDGNVDALQALMAHLPTTP